MGSLRAVRGICYRARGIVWVFISGGTGRRGTKRLRDCYVRILWRLIRVGLLSRLRVAEIKLGEPMNLLIFI